jgi:hypothetical protein
MDDAALRRTFDPLYTDIKPETQFHTRRPLLAHYTTIQAAELIVKSKEMWFSNPLYMNDLEEVRIGLIEGERAVLNSTDLATALRTDQRRNVFLHAFNYYGADYVQNYLNDTYVLCFSQHDPADNDGKLSMWRGYGGNGRGVAIVIDTGRFAVLPTSPLILAAVQYETATGRQTWLANKVTEFSRLLTSLNVPDAQLHVPALALLERVRIAAVFTKHKGFDEEQEWRVVYMRERDISKTFDTQLGYSIGPHGIEQRLKFRIAHHPGATAPGFGLDLVVDRIILGPTLNSPLARGAFMRMLTEHGETGLANRVAASSIPYRHKD